MKLKRLVSNEPAIAMLGKLRLIQRPTHRLRGDVCALYRTIIFFILNNTYIYYSMSKPAVANNEKIMSEAHILHVASLLNLQHKTTVLNEKYSISSRQVT